MEGESSFLERRDIKTLVTRIRRSLSEATKLQDEQLPHTPVSLQVVKEDISLAGNRSSAKISFECGYAMSSEKRNCWILRYRGTTVAPTSSRKQNDSFDSLSFTGTSLASEPKRSSSLPLRNARRVARIWPSDLFSRSSDEGFETATTNSPTHSLNYPPTSLLQKVFRAVELRSMFEQVQFSMAKDPPGLPLCWSRVGRTKIDLAPMLSNIRGRNDARKTPQEMLQEAIFCCSSLEHYHDSWVVKVDTTEDAKALPKIPATPVNLTVFIAHCLTPEGQDLEPHLHQVQKGDMVMCHASACLHNPFKVAPNTFPSPNILIHENASSDGSGVQFPGEGSAPAGTSETSIPLNTVKFEIIPNQQPGQPSMATEEENSANLYFQGGNKLQIVGKFLEHQLPKKKHRIDGRIEESLAESLGQVFQRKFTSEHQAETLASKRRKTAYLDQRQERLSRDAYHGEVIDNRKRPQQLRQSARRKVLTRWVADVSTAAGHVPGTLQKNMRSGRPQDANDKMTVRLSEFGQNSSHPDPRRSVFSNSQTSHSSKAHKFTECPHIDPLSMHTKALDWVRLSHLGHVSDYHGLERKYAFLPLRWDRSLKGISHCVEETLRMHKFDETVESDEEVERENRELNHFISQYSQKAKAEKNHRRPSGQKQAREDMGCSLISRPIIFDRQLTGPVRDGCPGADFRRCSSKSEKGNIYQSEQQKTFRKLEFNPLDLGIGDESSTTGRRSRSREIVSQRNASLLMLNELRHTFAFLSNYNAGFGKKSSQATRAELLEDKASPGVNFDKASANKFIIERSKDSSHGHVDGLELATRRNEQMAPSPIQLSHLTLVDEYCALMRKKAVSMPRNSTLSALQIRVNEAIDDLPVGAHDDEIVKDLKSFIRALRTYSGKADQERIEKKNHEEERTLQLRELEYRTRGRKPSAEDVELFNFVERPAIYGLLSETRKCRFGKSCKICTKHQDCNFHQTHAIFHPAVKRIDDDFYDESVEPGLRRSRTRERSVQQEFMEDALTSLQHRINFIKLYNEGWIATNKRNH